MADLLVVGTGLIGTSVGLACHGELDVVLFDRDAQALEEAVHRGAGRPWDGAEPASQALLAVPPRHIATVLKRTQDRGVALTYSHVSSVQARVQAEVEALDCDATSVCGGHPMAGSERSGPAAASRDLFAGRPWVLCPTPATSDAALFAARSLAEVVGADPVQLDPDRHDAAVALVSHLPHVVSAALAAGLASGGEEALSLAASGLRDTTRIAASPADMWVEVLALNARWLLPLVDGVQAQLAAYRDVLQAHVDQLAPVSDTDRHLLALLEQGRAGRALVPVKGTESDQAFTVVEVHVDDRPGQLAGVLTSAAEAGVNVEDVRVDHLAGRPRGVIELVLHAAAAADAARALTAAGWDARLTT